MCRSLRIKLKPCRPWAMRSNLTALWKDVRVVLIPLRAFRGPVEWEYCWLGQRDRLLILLDPVSVQVKEEKTGRSGKGRGAWSRDRSRIRRRKARPFLS